MTVSVQQTVRRDNAKISIIIPARNAQSTITRCIRRVFCNRYDNIECIVVVNDSSDKTLMVCRALQKQYPGLKVISTETGGVSYARNLGLDCASGDIIGFCDADDMYEPGAIDNVLSDFSRYASDIVITGFFRAEKNGNCLKKSKALFSLIPQLVSVKKIRLLVISNKDVVGSVWNKFFKRNAIMRCRFDTSLTHCEDTHFVMTVLKQDNLKILLSNSVTYNYIYEPLSTTNNADKIFDENDELKYFASINKISKLYRRDLRVLTELAAARTTLGIENYRFAETSTERKKRLRRVTAKNLWGYLLTAYERNIKETKSYMVSFFRMFIRESDGKVIE